MLLSEAILLGSVGTNQCKFRLKNTDGNTCALGAAGIAIGAISYQTPGIRTLTDAYFGESGNMWKNILDQIRDSFPILESRVDHPKERETWKLETIITQLNDTWGWTRPQIAAWVAEQEVKLGIVDAEATIEKEDICQVG